MERILTIEGAGRGETYDVKAALNHKANGWSSLNAIRHVLHSGAVHIEE
jgi:hypothetical protein